MILYVHSDASYLSTTKARSRAVGIHLLSDEKLESTYCKTFVPLMNGIIYVVYKILRNVMESAAEAKLGSVFINSQYVAPSRTTLIKMNHPRPSTLIQVDNTNAVVISNETIKQMISKALDMRFY